MSGHHFRKYGSVSQDIEKADYSVGVLLRTSYILISLYKVAWGDISLFKSNAHILSLPAYNINACTVMLHSTPLICMIQHVPLHLSFSLWDYRMYSCSSIL